jgi:16S rRNA (cytidine1402-2'-O)-methyltransferase
MTSRGKLVLAATPIGNLADASPRLCELLATADVIAAEDTRKAFNLMSGLGISSHAQVLSHFEANEAGRLPQLLSLLHDGKTVAVISDAGMPTVSDPGFRLVSAAAEAGIDITVVPGPSAVTTALALSGLPTDRFTFEGFLARKSGERTSQLQELLTEKRTMVFFESGHRIQETIDDMAKVFGAERRAAICRELTKTYEEVIRGTLQELAIRCETELLGEITVVVAGSSVDAELNAEELAADLLARGMVGKSVVAHLVSNLGMSKRDAFDLVVRLKPEK